MICGPMQFDEFFYLPLVLGPPMDKNNAADTATNLANHIRVLKTECGRLKHQLSLGKQTADLVTL